jgi:hypothetical protein
VTPAARGAGPWYVAPGGDDANTCQNPVAPCASIDGAIAKPSFAAGDTIWIATGTYSSSQLFVVDITKNVIVSGGWDAATFTRQSGRATIEGDEAGFGGVVVRNGVHATLDHIEVRAAPHDGITVEALGSLEVVSSEIVENGGSGLSAFGAVSVRMVDAEVRANGASGVFMDHYYSEPGGSLVVDRCTVSDNMQGGIANTGTTTITHALITRNVKSFGGGGGILAGGGNISITDSQIIGNTNSGDNGGGIYIGSGLKPGTTVYVARNQIRGNESRDGGGLYLMLDSGPAPSTPVEYNLISGNTSATGWCGGGIGLDGPGAILLNNVIFDNSGGGICTWGGNPGDSSIINNTIAGNMGEGVYVTNPFDTVVHLINNIVADNSGAGVRGWNDPDAHTLSHNLLWSNGGGNFVDLPDMTGIDGNIVAMSFLVERNSGRWHLGGCSAAIDAGTNELAPPIDFDGDARPYHGITDIGADEFIGVPTCWRHYLPLIPR